MTEKSWKKNSPKKKRRNLIKMSDIEKVKKLREATGTGLKDCNSAIKKSEKTKTVAEIDKEKLEKKYQKKKVEKLN